jgi:hypothetical protein
MKNKEIQKYAIAIKTLFAKSSKPKLTTQDKRDSARKRSKQSKFNQRTQPKILSQQRLLDCSRGKWLC